MATDNRHFARLNDTHLSAIAQSLRAQASGDERTANSIADALDSVVKKRCDVREARHRSNPARMGMVALRKVTGWASVRVHAEMERPAP